MLKIVPISKAKLGVLQEIKLTILIAGQREVSKPHYQELMDIKILMRVLEESCAIQLFNTMKIELLELKYK